MKSPKKSPGGKTTAKIGDLKPNRNPKGGSLGAAVAAPIKPVGGNILPPSLDGINVGNLFPGG